MLARLHRRITSFCFVLISFLLSTAIANAQAKSTPENLLRLGKQAYEEGNYIQAEQYFREALQKAERDGASASVRARALSDLVGALLTQGRTAESETFLDRAFQLVQTNRDVDPRFAPIVLGQLGSLYQTTGRPK